MFVTCPELQFQVISISFYYFNALKYASGKKQGDAD